MLKTKIIQNNFFFYFSISSFLVSTYYFNLRSKLFFDEKIVLLSSIVLFIFSFIFFYILVNLTYYCTDKFKIIKIEIFNILFFSWLFVQLIKGSFDLINIISFQEFFGGLAFFSKIDNILIKSVSTHFIPYIISIIFVLALNKHLRNLLRFILILGSIFLILSLYDLGKNYFIHNYNFASDVVKVEDNKFDKKKRAIVIILDSFDPEITFSKKYSGVFKNFEDFKNNSFYGPNSYAPAKYTMLSVPSILMGIPNKGFTVKSRQYFLRNNDNQLVKLNYNNSLFGELNKLGFSSYFINTTLPICKYFLLDMKNCEDVGPEVAWGTETLDWKNGIQFNFPIARQTIKLYRIIRNYNSKNEQQEKQIYSENFIKKIKSIELSNFQNINDIDGRGISTFSNIQSKIDQGYNLIFLHINLPHNSSEQAMKVFNFTPKNGFENFMLNTLLADLFLGKLMSMLNKSDDNFMVTVLSDHWFRAKDKKTSKYYPSLFISKILNDNSQVTSDKNNSLVHLKEYLINYFRGNISTNKDTKLFFENKKFYEPYINE